MSICKKKRTIPGFYLGTQLQWQLNQIDHFAIHTHCMESTFCKRKIFISIPNLDIGALTSTVSLGQHIQNNQ